MDRIQIEQDRAIKHVHEELLSKRIHNPVVVLVVALCIMLGAILILGLQLSDTTFYPNVKKYSQIKNNINSWSKIISQQEEIESSQYKNIILKENRKFEKYNCIDYGDHFIPIRINNITFLPEAIRRGTGDAWKVKKTHRNDPSAKQFCKYLIEKYSYNTLQCGVDLFEKLGYGGFFDELHWCNSFKEKIDK